MGFEQALEVWLKKHIEASSAERRKRLEKGLGYATVRYLRYVWWPLFGNFDYLYPEYEVRDFRDGYRFIDLAYIRHWVWIAIELDGYTVHGRDVTQEKFDDDRDRQTDLVIDGWWVMRFSDSRVREKPRSCQMRTQLMISKALGEEEALKGLSVLEREIVRMSLRNGHTVRPSQVELWLGVGNQYARKLLRRMAEQGIFLQDEGKQRVHLYKLASDRYPSLR